MFPGLENLVNHDLPRERAEAMRKFLFVCVENAGRSQMALAFAKKYGLRADSAGTVPSKTVNPTVVGVMKEKGLDMSSLTPKALTAEMVEKADLVIYNGLLCRGGLSETHPC